MAGGDGDVTHGDLKLAIQALELQVKTMQLQREERDRQFEDMRNKFDAGQAAVLAEVRALGETLHSRVNKIWLSALIAAVSLIPIIGAAGFVLGRGA